MASKRTKRTTKPKATFVGIHPMEFIALKEELLGAMNKLALRIETLEASNRNDDWSIHRLSTRISEVESGARINVNGVSANLTAQTQALNKRIDELWRHVQARQSSEQTWQSADGSIRVGDMSDEHVINALRMTVRRHGAKFVKLYAGMLGTDPFSKERAASLRALIHEAHKRNLKWEEA